MINDCFEKNLWALISGKNHLFAPYNFVKIMQLRDSICENLKSVYFPRNSGHPDCFESEWGDFYWAVRSPPSSTQTKKFSRVIHHWNSFRTIYLWSLSTDTKLSSPEIQNLAGASLIWRQGRCKIKTGSDRIDSSLRRSLRKVNPSVMRSRSANVIQGFPVLKIEFAILDFMDFRLFLAIRHIITKIEMQNYKSEHVF